MADPRFFKDYRSFTSFNPDRYGKATLFENQHILVGLNCLEPGQEMNKHAHEVQCRFYIVLEGSAHVWIGDEPGETNPGMVIWVPPGHTHRIVNSGNQRLVMLVGIAPPQAD